MKEFCICPLNKERHDGLDAPLEMGVRMPAIGVTNQTVTSR